jgi:hypothetical protein
VATGLCKTHYAQQAKGRDLTPIRAQGRRAPVFPDTRYGRLVVLREVPERYMDGKRQFLCRCDCGVELTVVGGSLQAGLSRSCGCLRNELAAARGRASTRHGHYAGDVASRTYASWRGMHKRCKDPNNASYANYGERGIVVCERWASFENFLADMGERPEGLTLDRIDNDANYEPGNCRWATPTEQSRNRRPKRSSGNRSTKMAKGRIGEAFVIPRDAPVHSMQTGKWTPSGKTLTVYPYFVNSYGEAGTIIVWAGRGAYWRSVCVLPNGEFVVPSMPQGFSQPFFTYQRV